MIKIQWFAKGQFQRRMQQVHFELEGSSKVSPYVLAHLSLCN